MKRVEPNATERDGRTPPDEHAGLSAALDLLPFPALLVDTGTGRLALANEAARRLGLQPFEDGAAVRRLVREAGAEGAEFAWPGAGGDRLHRVFCRGVPPKDGVAAPALLAFLDVSREKAAEAGLRAALEARDEFFSVAAHELKDPLFALQLSLQLLEHGSMKLGEVPPHVRKHLDISHRQTDRLMRLVDNLLDVSRIENGRLQLDAEALDLCELAGEAAGRFRDQARQAGSTLDVEADAPVLGYFDRMKVEQVVNNLLANAVKYGRGRPITLRVGGTADEAVIEVEDRGVGIAPEDRERVFRRFERASSGHRRDSLGLGLFIVRSLAEAHGGTVGLRSEVGQGSTFSVTLPRNCPDGRTGAAGGGNSTED